MNGEAAPPTAPHNSTKPKGGFHWIEAVVILFIMLLLGLCLAPGMIVLPAVYLCAGWFWFLERVGPQIQVSPQGVGVGLSAVVLLIGGIQLAIQSFAPTASWPLRHTIRSTLGVLAMFLAGICLVGLGHEISWWSRSKIPWMFFQTGSARERSQSRNNLKQVGLALHNYHDAFRVFPAGGVFAPDGKAGHGWMAAILAYVDQQPLYNEINFQIPWYDPRNRHVYETRIFAYENPMLAAQRPSTSSPYAPAHYAANGHILTANRSLTIAEIKDGSSTTILAGEVADNFQPWGDVVNMRYLESGINKSPSGFGSPFKGGAQFLLTDGSVRFINENIDPKVLKALATPAAKDVVGEDF